MITVQRVSAAALICLLIASPLAAQEQEPSPFERIPWQNGPVLGDLGGEAQVQVPGWDRDLILGRNAGWR